jgi:hypothetical protein
VFIGGFFKGKRIVSTIAPEIMDSIKTAIRNGTMTPELFEQAADYAIGHYLPGWKWQFTNSVRRLGCCWYDKKLLEFSVPYIVEHPTTAKDTLMHEIAHGIAGARAGHGREWKQIAWQLGATPRACVEVSRPKKIYSGAAQLAMVNKNMEDVLNIF